MSLEENFGETPVHNLVASPWQGCEIHKGGVRVFPLLIHTCTTAPTHPRSVSNGSCALPPPPRPLCCPFSTASPQAFRVLWESRAGLKHESALCLPVLCVQSGHKEMKENKTPNNTTMCKCTANWLPWKISWEPWALDSKLSSGWMSGVRRWHAFVPHPNTSGFEVFFTWFYTREEKGNTVHTVLLSCNFLKSKIKARARLAQPWGDREFLAILLETRLFRNNVIFFRMSFLPSWHECINH